MTPLLIARTITATRLLATSASESSSTSHLTKWAKSQKKLASIGLGPKKMEFSVNIVLLLPAAISFIPFL